MHGGVVEAERSGTLQGSGDIDMLRRQRVLGIDIRLAQISTPHADY